MAKKKKKTAEQKPEQTVVSEVPAPVRSELVLLRLGRSQGAKCLLFLALLICFAFLLYSRTLNAPFVFDDGQNIRDNAQMRVYHLSPSELFRAATAKPSPKRMVANLTFALNYYFGGYKLPGFHAVNILVHALTAFGLFLLACALLRSPWAMSRGLKPGLIPWFAALLFLAHPAETQAVSYIVQRMTSLATMFFVFSVYFYARLRELRPGWARALFMAACAACGLLAFGSKQIAATLPAVLILYEWFFVQDLDLKWLRRYGPWIAGAILVMVVMALVYTGFHPWQLMNAPYKVRDFTLPERVLTQFRVVVHYISLLVLPLPSRMNLDYAFPKSTGLFTPVSTFLCLVFIAGLLTSAAWTAKRHRLYSFAVLWFFGNLVIESTVLPLEMIFDHRIYLPSLMLFVAFSAAVSGKLPTKKAAAVLVAVLLALSALTALRNETWKDELSLFADVVKKSPEKARPNYTYCAVLYEHDRVPEAIPYCEKATRLNPLDPKGWFSLARACEHRSTSRPDLAEKYYRKALEVSPHHPKSSNALALLLAGQGKAAEALALTYDAVRTEPQNPVVQLNASQIMLVLNRPKEAELRLKAALDLDPGYARAHTNLGIVYAKQGKTDLAEREWNAALTGEEDDCVTLHNLGNLMEKQGRTAEALVYYKKALRARPDFGPSLDAVRRLARSR
ncbi:MAG: tetratricopeptide repeat protein [Thermodesulfobacteriota bacterium]